MSTWLKVSEQIMAIMKTRIPECLLLALLFLVIRMPEPVGAQACCTAGEGLLLSAGKMYVNPAAVRTSIPGTANLNFPSVGVNACQSLTISVPGAVLGDEIVGLTKPHEMDTYLLTVQPPSVSLADTVAIRVCNWTAAAIDPPELAWTVWVGKSF